MTSRDRKPREVAQRSSSYFDRVDELIEILLAHYHPCNDPERCTSGKPPYPSAPEAVQSTPPASPNPEVEQQAVPPDPTGTRKDGHDHA